MNLYYDHLKTFSKHKNQKTKDNSLGGVFGLTNLIQSNLHFMHIRVLR